LNVTVNVTDYTRRIEEFEGWQMGVTTYRLGEKWWCVVDNVSPGARLCSHAADSSAAAESHAVGVAKRLLGRTRRFPSTAVVC